MSTLLADARHALRLIARSPGYALAVIVTLALGIGANTAIFSVVRAVVLRPLPYADADRLVWANGSAADIEDVLAAAPALAGASYMASNLYDLPADDLGDAEQARGDLVTPSFFSMLGVAPELGRVFGPADDMQPLCVIGDRLWRTRYHGDRNVLGKTIVLTGRPHTIVGVMPPSFRLPSTETMLWVTFGWEMATPPGPAQRHDHSFRIFRMIARLAPGATMAQAQAQATAVMQRLAHDHPDTNRGIGLTLQPLRAHMLGDTATILWLLFGAVGLVLLIACANVASLALARTSTRGREIAVRLALGARPWRIARQLMTESILLSLLGGALGVVVALWGVDGLRALGPRDLPRIDEVGVDGAVLAVALALSVLSGMIFGLLPAWQAARGRFGEVLHGARGVTGARGSSRLHAALVVVEVALSLVLLISASLCLRSFARLTSVPLGLEPTHALTLMLTANVEHIRDPATAAPAFERILDRLAAEPGIEAVGGANARAPVSLQRGTAFAIGDEPLVAGEGRFAAFVACSPDYFRALGTAVVRGRVLARSDGAGAPLVAVVNRSLAARLWPGQDPIGRTLRLVNPQQSPAPRTIVGVVDDVKYQGLDADSPDTIYTPYAQTPFPWMYVVARTRAEPATLAAAVKRAVADVDPAQSVMQVRPMREVVAESLAQPRFQLGLVGLFAALAVILAFVGLYGVIAYLVAQRTQEIGIRVALGAQRGDVLRLVVGRGLVLTAIGVGVGLGAAAATTRLLRAMLFQISPTDPLVFIVVPIAFVAVALIASWLPARRAASVDPMIALRAE